MINNQNKQINLLHYFCSTLTKTQEIPRQTLLFKNMFTLIMFSIQLVKLRYNIALRLQSQNQFLPNSYQFITSRDLFL